MKTQCIIFAAALSSLSSLGAAFAADAIPDYIKASVNDEGRPPSMVLRDPNLKPAETLAWVGIKPGDKVVELYPDGYYTRLIGKVVGSKGRDYGVTMLREQTMMNAVRERQSRGQVTGPLMFDRMIAIENIPEYNWTPTIQWAGQFGGHVALPEQIDVVWIDHYHDLQDPIDGEVDMAVVNRSFFRAMKPGGTYFVEDMVSNPGTGLTVGQVLHRSEPAYVRKQIEQAGFVFDGESKMLANPDDDHSYRTQPIPVRDYTDRYMMKFKKPTNAPDTDKRPKPGQPDPMAGYYANTLIVNDGEPRHYLFRKDGVYNVFGRDPSTVPMDQVHEIELLGGYMETGKWSYDADGHVCVRPEFPWERRAIITCIPLPAGAQPGAVYDQTLSDGRQVKAQLVAGRVLPK